MEQDDPEARIAELERQLREVKAAANSDHSANYPYREDERAGTPALPEMTQSGGSQTHDATRLADAFMRAAAESDTSVREALERAGIRPGVTMKVNGKVVYHGQELPPNINYQNGFASPLPFDISADSLVRPQNANRRSRLGLDSPGDGFGAVAAAMGVPIAVGLGGSATLTAAIPASALWTSRFVCGAPNRLMLNTSHYSYKPSQSGTSVNFQCLAADGGHDVNWFMIMALQGLLIAVVLGGALAVGLAIRRRRRKQPLRASGVILASCLGALALAAVAWQVIAGSAVTQMPSGGSLTIDGNAETKTIACNDGHLTIDGREETVTVIGHCNRISVDGVIHHVTVDSVDAIDVGGLKNVVTYHAGSPEISAGGSNTVQRG
ncbi:DUF3060 domain-containing protein [Mycobacterium sp. OAE908]|uniref:DUF3060 domain-containing protein n=1 Tax=Mycobacterium sp. OAE908 TaxID=2817899 RepID=UPI001AE44894